MIDEYIEKNDLYCLDKPKHLKGQPTLYSMFSSYTFYFLIIGFSIVFFIFLYHFFTKNEFEQKNILETKTYKKTLDKIKENLKISFRIIEEQIHLIQSKINAFIFDNHIVNDTLVVRKYKPIYLL